MTDVPQARRFDTALFQKKDEPKTTNANILNFDLAKPWHGDCSIRSAKGFEPKGGEHDAVNYDKPDYVEYEVVKGRDSFEVQIDFDKNSHKANKVDVVTNIWKADATKKALQPEKDTQARR